MDNPQAHAEAPSPPHSDHAAHTAPAEPHPIKKNLWQRWMAWSGSFLVISILLHVVLLGGATVLVVQVVQGRKEKMKFTAPPPSPAGMVEHKVKPSKKAAAAPAISKRITSTAANASIALPAMEMSSSTGPDVMASVMSGLGSSALGAGAAGGPGMASMPLSGMTAFGFRGATANVGLSGHIYDLKQTANGKPTDIKDDGDLKNPHLLDDLTSYNNIRNGELWRIYRDQSTRGKRADLLTESVQNHAAVVNEFIDKNWDESVLKRYYESKDKVTAFQFFIPSTTSDQALKAFGVEKEIKKTHFLIHYKGFVKGLKDGEFRFRVASSSLILIRFGEQNVFGSGGNPLLNMKDFAFKNTDNPKDTQRTIQGYPPGKWFRVEAGKKYPVEVLLECTGDWFKACVLIEERNPEKPYERRTLSIRYPQDPITYRYPVFALMKGLPTPPYPKEQLMTQQEDPKYAAEAAKHPGYVPENWRPGEHFPEAASEPLVFPGTK